MLNSLKPFGWFVTVSGCIQDENLLCLHGEGHEEDCAQVQWFLGFIDISVAVIPQSQSHGVSFALQREGQGWLEAARDGEGYRAVPVPGSETAPGGPTTDQCW